MIRLTKGPTPPILVRNGESWTRAIVEKLARGDELTVAERTRYRHSEIKMALVAETSGKCAYCESNLLHIHHGDVEHIYPKSLAPEKTVVWENLTLACEVCNQNKSNRDPKAESIIDPYVTDPDDHLAFVGALVFPLGTIEGASTTGILELNRMPLAERRMEQLQALMRIVETLLRPGMSVAARKAIYDDLMTRELSPSSAYSAMKTAAIRSIEPKIAPLVE